MRQLAFVFALVHVAMSCAPTRDTATDDGRAPRQARTAQVVQSPAGRQLAAWLAVFNSGDEAALQRHRAQHFAYGVASAAAANIDPHLRGQPGVARFELLDSRASGPTRLIATLKELSSERFARAVLEVDPVEPYQVTSFQIAEIPTPEELRPARTSEQDAIAALEAELNASATSDRFSGTILVAKDGLPIYRAARGFADRDNRRANQLDTRFRIGSMSKMFTAVAILQLVQAGKLALHDRLGDLLAQYADGSPAAMVTVHHLLTHTGGTGDIWGPQFDAHRSELRAIGDYVNLYARRPLRFAPGSQWEYSNYGFILLGAILEQVSGHDYYSWVSSHVFEPARMRSTASPVEDDARLELRSIPYTRPAHGTGWVSARDTLPYRATSAGGADSTVDDLLRFADAVQHHTLLDARHSTLLTTGKVTMPYGGRYAYGFTDTTWRGVRCVGHEGGAPGMNGELAICDSGYTVAVLANMDPPAASRLANFVLDRLPGRPQAR